jgi:hypothetical protein
LLLGRYWQNITVVGINTCPAANFAKGSRKIRTAGRGLAIH